MFNTLKMLTLLLFILPTTPASSEPALLDVELVQSFTEHNRNLHRIEILPLDTPTVISIDQFGAYKMWDALSLEILWEGEYFQISSGHSSQLRNDSSFALSSNRQFIAIGSIEKLEILRVVDGSLVTKIWPQNVPYATYRYSKIAFSPDDRYLAAYDEVSETVALFDSEDGKQIKSFKRKNASPSNIKFDSSMSKLMLIGQSGLDIWDILTAKLVRSISAQEITGDEHLGTDIEVSQDNRWLAATYKKDINSDNLILVYDLETYEPVKIINAIGGCEKVVFSLDQTEIMGLCGRQIVVWNINSGERVAESKLLDIAYWRIFPYEANVGFSKDHRMFVSCINGEAIGVFEIRR